MDIKIPELSLIILIGVAGSGKSTFARKHFQPTEVISSDTCRGLVSDDETDQGATKDAFEVLHFIAAKRLAGGRLTVIDATNVKAEDRKPLLKLAKKYHFFAVAIALNLPPKLCQERNKNRSNRQFSSQVVHRQSQYLRRGLNKLKREGFRYHYILSSVEEIDKVSIHRQPLWNNLRQEHGPFDIIGDIHEEGTGVGKPPSFKWRGNNDAANLFAVPHQGRETGLSPINAHCWGKSEPRQSYRSVLSKPHCLAPRRAV